jgi:hypothetical protein
MVCPGCNIIFSLFPTVSVRFSGVLYGVSLYLMPVLALADPLERMKPFQVCRVINPLIDRFSGKSGFALCL